MEWRYEGRKKERREVREEVFKVSYGARRSRTAKYIIREELQRKKLREKAEKRA